MTWTENVLGLQHIGIPTNDLEETIAFYVRLGFVLVHEAENDETSEKIAFLQFKDVMLEAYENGCAEKIQGAIDHIAFDVQDIEAAHAAAKEMNLPFFQEEIKYLPFWVNGIKFFIVSGPNGEKLEFCEIIK